MSPAVRSIPSVPVAVLAPSGVTVTLPLSTLRVDSAATVVWRDSGPPGRYTAPAAISTIASVIEAAIRNGFRFKKPQLNPDRLGLAAAASATRTRIFDQA